MVYSDHEPPWDITRVTSQSLSVLVIVFSEPAFNIGDVESASCQKVTFAAFA